MTKVCVVIPCPTDPPNGYPELPRDVTVVIVDDSTDLEGQNSQLDTSKIPARYEVLQHRSVANELAFPRKSAASRNLGHCWAYVNKFDVTIALDYDCLPPPDFVDKHLAALGLHKDLSVVNGSWVNPISHKDIYARGYPYEYRPSYQLEQHHNEFEVNVKANLGLWTGFLDVNAIDRLQFEIPEHPGNYANETRATYSNIPICGMNFAFRTELTPAYFLLPNFKVSGWEVSRHDDIWGGYILHKIMRKAGDTLTFGQPTVEHTKLSNINNSLRYEHWMHLLNQSFYRSVDEAVSAIPLSTYHEMFADLVEYLEVRWTPPLQSLIPAMRRWYNLF